MGWRSRYRIHEGSAFACAHYHSEAPEPITLVQKIMLFLRETQDVSFYGFSSVAQVVLITSSCGVQNCSAYPSRFSNVTIQAAI
jgi:hypothetical protein